MCVYIKAPNNLAIAAVPTTTKRATQAQEAIALEQQHPPQYQQQHHK
jgi:hypothetical protein